MRRPVALAAGLWLISASLAQGEELDLEGYRVAHRTGRTALVTGRVFEERRRPHEPDRPLGGAIVTLLPHSRALLETLERLRADARRSAASYRGTVAALREAIERWELALIEQGGVDLVHRTAAAGDGAFRVEGVPAGRWLLIATRGTQASQRSVKLTRKDRAMFDLEPRLRGYHVVTFWLQDVTLTAGTFVAAPLTDRTGWFAGVLEQREREPDARR